MTNTTRPAEEEGGNGWMPISTAPKDGSYVLLREQYSDAPFVGSWHSHGRGRWAASLEHVDAEGGWDGAIAVDKVSQELITHWMPIPAAPGAAAAAPSAWLDEDQLHTVERAADLLEHYGTFIARHVTSADIELHPYPPEIAGTAEDLRSLAAQAQAASTFPCVGGAHG